MCAGNSLPKSFMDGGEIATASRRKSITVHTSLTFVLETKELGNGSGWSCGGPGFDSQHPQSVPKF